LSGPIPAGDYHLIADGFLSDAPLVRFELLWRRRGSSEDMPIVTFEHQYPANPVTFSQYEETRRGEQVPSSGGDLLVLRMSLIGGAPQEQAAYVPVGEIFEAPQGARFLTIDIPAEAPAP
jgi:hypothetical protein